MPLPLNYTHIDSVEDMASDIALDRQRGFFWAYSSGGSAWDYELGDWADVAGPLYTKISTSNGQAVFSGRGPVPDWREPGAWNSWYMAVSQETGNLYVDEDHGSTQRRIQCLHGDDLHVVHTSPYFTGLYTACDLIVVYEPYVYVVSVAPGSTTTVALTRLPLDLSAIHWTAVVFSGPSDFDINHNSVSIDNAGNAWVGVVKTLARVSPTGTVTSFNLTASLNAAARIRATGYDPGQNALGMLIFNRGGTPVTQVVRFSCATNTVNATVSFPSPNSIDIAASHCRVWDYIPEGMVLLRYEANAAYPNSSAIMEFDLRNMLVARTYRPEDDWGIYRAPVTRLSAEEPIYAWRRSQMALYDGANGDSTKRAIWLFNSFGARIYPSEAYPLGNYGVWRLSLSQPATYYKVPENNWAYDQLYVDAQRGFLWQLGPQSADGGPRIWKIRTSDGAIILSGLGPDIPPDTDQVEPYWFIEYLGLSQQTGNVYINDSSGDPVNRFSRIRCLSGDDMRILHTSPLFDDSVHDLEVIDPYVYVWFETYISGGGHLNYQAHMRLARLPLDLSTIDWVVTVWDEESSTVFPRYLNPLNVDRVGNVWTGIRQKLAKITPAGVVTQTTVPAISGYNIWGHAYDPSQDDLCLLLQGSANHMVARFHPTASGGDLEATDVQTDWGFGVNELKFTTNHLNQMTNSRLWLRLTAPSAVRDTRGDFVEYDFARMQRIRTLSLRSDWQIPKSAADDNAREAAWCTSGYVYDHCTASLWLWNASFPVYPDVADPDGSYGVWRLPLPDFPSLQCARPPTECGTYVKTLYEDWAYDRLHFDRQRGFIWQMNTGGPHFVKIRTSNAELLLKDKSPAIPDWETEEGYWDCWYFGISQQTGNIYVDDGYGIDGSGDESRIRCLSGEDLTLLHTSPYLPTYIWGMYVVDPYVYTLESVYQGTDPNRHERAYLTRFPLDLSRIDWRVQVWDILIGLNYGHKPSFGDHQFPSPDSEGNLWFGLQTDLYRVTPTGSTTKFALGAFFPVHTTNNAHATILAQAYDTATNSIVGLWANDFVPAQVRSAALFRFSLDTLTLVAYEENANWDTVGNGGSWPNNWGRIPDGRLWMRLRWPEGDFAEVNTRSLTYDNMVPIEARHFTTNREFNLTANWCLSDVKDPASGQFGSSPLSAAQSTSGYVWDDCSPAIWLYNGSSGIYPDAETAGWKGWYGIWKFPLPDQPAADCPREPCGGFEAFHDVLLDQYISYGCKIRIKFQTYVTRMRQGHEERIGEWQDPIWTFDITPALRDQADLDYLLAFFRARNGPFYIFKFFNPLDYRVQNEHFGYGDGTTTEFQLCRQYATGIPGDGLYYVRPIVLPVPGAQIFVGGSLLPSSAYTLELLGGAVKFATPPAPGAQLTWTGSYYTPVRFLNGRVYSTVEHYQHYEDQIMLVEERIPPCAAVMGEPESPDFVEARFPDRYAQRATMGPEIDVITISSDSGGTYRQLQFQSAKIRFTVEETEQPQSVVAALLAFFLNRKGRLYGFRAKDITDFSLNGAVLEAADGTRTQFQIIKKYDSGPQTSVRTILKPNADVIVDIAGTPVDPQPSVSTETGMITFATPPAPGSVITCSGTFDVPVRFDADEAVFSIQGFEAFSMESMILIETELGLPGFAIEPVTPALVSVQAQAAPAPMPRLAMPGQESCQLPPRPAVTQYLEFRGGTTGSGTGAYSGLQVERPGSMYRLLAGATSLTVAFLVSHVKSGTPSGVPGAVYPMALFSHVMPGMGTDPALYASTGFTLYLANYGAGIALDAAVGAYRYATSGSLCVPQLNLTPRVPAQGAVSATPIADNNLMHAYVVTFDWLSHQAYWSGSVYGRQDFPPDAFLYNTCFAGTGGADARLLEATALKYLGSKDLTIGQGEVTNDGWLGVVSQAPQTPAFHSPLSASVYEHLLLPTFGRVDMQRILRDVHATILKYWGSKYSTGYANVQSPVAPGFDLFWWRADENVSVADTPTGAIAAWAPVVCGFQWLKANSSVMSDEGQPRVRPITTMPALSDALMLADGRRLLARQT